VAPQAGDPGLVVLRSFGKFYGLAGVRLGFAIGDTATIERLSTMAGPWPVAGPALEIGASRCRHRMGAGDDAASGTGSRADRCAGPWLGAGGGTHLFRLYDTPDAAAAQNRLAAIASGAASFHGRHA
jgi:cobalamin biosynthetic protein CobC